MMEEGALFKRAFFNHYINEHSIWPIYRENPLGWRDAGKSVLKAECLAYIYDFMSISVLLNLSWLELEGQVKHRENKQSEQKDYWIFTGERQG
jgi:hypothetical protein